MKFNELLRSTMEFLRGLIARYRSVDIYFEVLKKTAESEEVKNERLSLRIELKKKEFELKERIQEAKSRGKKLEEEYQEYDPKAAARRTRKIYGLLALSMVLFFVLLRACTGC